MPSADKFTLEQVLRHTRRQEERKQLELLAFSGEERQRRDQLEALRARQHRGIRELSQRSRSGAIDPAAVDSALVYLSSVAGSISEQVDAVAEAEASVLESRARLVDVLREKRALENLKRRQAAAAAREANRRESKATDDITSARFARRPKGA